MTDVILLLAMTMKFSIIDSLRAGKPWRLLPANPAETCVSRGLTPDWGKYSGGE
jgi:hypothetical protein